MSGKRRPARRRAGPTERGRPPHGCDLRTLAASVEYGGSPYHRWPGNSSDGVSAARPDATRCPPDITRDIARRWLRSAIEAGDVGGIWEPDTYPQRAWKRVDGKVFEARITNRTTGEYHGYPIAESEAPRWLA